MGRCIGCDIFLDYLTGDQSCFGWYVCCELVGGGGGGLWMWLAVGDTCGPCGLVVLIDGYDGLWDVPMIVRCTAD